VTDGADEPDPAAIAAAVGGCPSVAALSGGRFGEVTTYLPGTRIPGVAVAPGGVRVSVVGTTTATAASLTAEIRAALVPLVHSLPVEIIWADIALPAT
jgi:hypothetical protein